MYLKVRTNTDLKTRWKQDGGNNVPYKTKNLTILAYTSTSPILYSVKTKEKTSIKFITFYQMCISMFQSIYDRLLSVKDNIFAMF